MLVDRDTLTIFNVKTSNQAANEGNKASLRTPAIFLKAFLFDEDMDLFSAICSYNSLAFLRLASSLILMMKHLSYFCTPSVVYSRKDTAEPA